MPDRTQELSAAIAAVRRAAIVCRSVQAKLVTADTLEKKDKSPVTVADFASQAVVCHALAQAFPDDPIVGEEDAAELKTDENAALRASVVERVGDVVDGLDESAVLAAIDRGGATPDGNTKRFWTLDPIDGTKGFLRGQQYAIALGLIENGKVVLGVLGCPNLDDPGSGQTGVLMTATAEGKTEMVSLDDESAAPKAATVSDDATTVEARFCESVESATATRASPPGSPRPWASPPNRTASTVSASTRPSRGATRRSISVYPPAPTTARRSGTTPRA